ncbi:MAG: hypothetical protein Q6363_008140 [Candidatus Njordarchaeota archaeon]
MEKENEIAGVVSRTVKYVVLDEEGASGSEVYETKSAGDMAVVLFNKLLQYSGREDENILLSGVLEELKTIIDEYEISSIEIFKSKKCPVPRVAFVSKKETIPVERLAYLGVLIHVLLFSNRRDFLERIKKTDLKISYQDSYTMKPKDMHIFVLEGTPTRGIVFVRDIVEKAAPKYMICVIDFSSQIYTKVLVF